MSIYPTKKVSNEPDTSYDRPQPGNPIEEIVYRRKREAAARLVAAQKAQAQAPVVAEGWGFRPVVFDQDAERERAFDDEGWMWRQQAQVDENPRPPTWREERDQAIALARAQHQARDQAKPRLKEVVAKPRLAAEQAQAPAFDDKRWMWNKQAFDQEAQARAQALARIQALAQAKPLKAHSLRQVYLDIHAERKRVEQERVDRAQRELVDLINLDRENRERKNLELEELKRAAARLEAERIAAERVEAENKKKEAPQVNIKRSLFNQTQQENLKAHKKAEAEKKQADISKFVQGSIDVMKGMLEDKTITDVDVRDRTWYDSTALMYQAQYGTTAGMQFLIGKGADVNTHDKEIGTPLRGAIIANDPDKVKLLLKSGAGIVDDDLEFAAEYELPEMVKLLKEWKPPTKAVLKGMSPELKDRAKVLQDVAKVLQDVAKAEAANPHRDSYARIKVFVRNNGDIDMMRSFLKPGGDISDVNIILDENGEQKTALMYASGIEGKLPVMSFLLGEAKASIDFQNNKGLTALHYAAGYDGKGNDNNQEDKVKLLLEKGANRTLMDNSGHTPLKLAMSKGHKKIVDWLPLYIIR